MNMPIDPPKNLEQLEAQYTERHKLALEMNLDGERMYYAGAVMAIHAAQEMEKAQEHPQ